MSVSTKANIIGGVVALIGTAMVWYAAGWVAAVGLFLFAWGNNMQQSVRLARGAA